MKQVISPERALQIVHDTPGPIAYDVETTGLEHSDVVCGYVLTNSEYSVYVPVRHGGGGNITDVDYYEQRLAAAFKDRARQGAVTVGHNLAFDQKMGAKHGVLPLHPLEDTQINEGLINDIAPGFSLDACAKRYGVTQKLGNELYEELARRFGGPPTRAAMKFFSKMPGDHDLVVDYATGDGVTTLELRNAQQPYLDEEHGSGDHVFNLRQVWGLECRLIPHLHRIHARGLRIDLGVAEEVLAAIATRRHEAISKFPAGFNVRSATDVAGLFGRLGIDDYPRTKPTKSRPNGSPSFREQWLKTNEWGRNILAVRQLDKAVDSFITPLIKTHYHDGHVHPVLNQSKGDENGAIGGRLSCSDPNMQAFPKRNREVGKPVRRLVVPRRGRKLGEADYKQQEPRLFAHYSEDERLVGGYRSGELDIHAIVTADFSLDRDTAKRMGMGMLTGMQPAALAGHMGWDQDRAAREHAKFLNESFPGIGGFQRGAKAAFKSRGWVRTILGRIAHLDDPRFAYRGVSRIIQGGGGDIMKTGLVDACEFCDAEGDIDILMSIHDSTMFDFEPDAKIGELQRVLENVAPKLGISVPIPVDVGIGDNWSEASYGK